MNINHKPDTSKKTIEELKKDTIIKLKKIINEVIDKNKTEVIERGKFQNSTENSTNSKAHVNYNFKHNWDHFNTLTENQKAVLEAIQNVKERCRI